ncbi:cobalamin biosynthesis protein [Methylobacterium sp. BTF04]|uniref:cobalamin biosynthesis protein n=1 Tax=Methylobacterium sp. BTF04 TaxID=2708300 RepID=UPI0013D447EC|nr:cobalamin biosynthesis protein [Methylobacterium sp. BTF04]NEU13037.1 cobalamin biosynthesis protein [Methylobacterium sp. BTF04]
MGLGQAVTMARDCVAGLGFRHATPTDEIVGLIHQALAACGLDPGRLGRLATAADRAEEPAIRAVAAVFAVPLVAVPSDALIAVDDLVVTRSGRIAASRGIGSVAEAAALAVAGPQATLLLPRIASGGATCALALGPQSVTQAT